MTKSTNTAGKIVFDCQVFKAMETVMCKLFTETGGDVDLSNIDNVHRLAPRRLNRLSPPDRETS